MVDTRAFRQELTEIQKKLDEYDDNFEWDSKVGTKELMRLYNEGRQPLIDKLEDWYSRERRLAG
jgi:uncharacterized protein YutE (UPF0331/DUF86 family)